ncbi:MAG: Do family serine endopeptidase [Methylococcales bacterium]
MRHYNSHRNAQSTRAESIQQRFTKTWIVATTAFVIAALAVAFAGARTAISQSTAPLTLTGGILQKTNSIADLIETVKPAVANISVSGKNNRRTIPGGPPSDFPQGSPFQEFFRHRDGLEDEPRRMREPEFNALGSGFIISSDGYVVTNSHVVNKAEQVTVILDNGKQYQAAIQGIDSKTDIALLKIENKGPFPYVVFGESDTARIGDQIVAIGNPFGLGNTATTGIISARGRDIHSGPFDDFIQIDAPINQGNSGGPLFDMQGKVIGINTAIYSPNGGNVGIGFAIPSAQAENIVEQLKGNGFVERSWLGIQIQPLTEQLAESLNLDRVEGGLIARVSPDSPATRAGLKVGDVITSFDDHKIESPKDLALVVASAKPNQQYSVSIWRDGESRNLTVVTSLTRENNPRASLNPKPLEAGGAAELGLALAPLNKSTRRQFGVNDEIQKGAVIVNVKSGSPAAMIGLQIGDVITRVGNQEISGPLEIVEEIHKTATSREPVLMLVSRGNSSRFVSLDVA